MRWPWGHRTGRLRRAALAIVMLTTVVSVPSAQAQSAACFSAPNPSEVSVLGQPSSLAVGDFNGDNKLDLVTNEFFANKVAIQLGNGSGGFGAPSVPDI